MRYILLIFFLAACETEYLTVKEVIACQGERCRVILSNNKTSITYGPVLKGDKVRKDWRYKNLYRVELEN